MKKLFIFLLISIYTIGVYAQSEKAMTGKAIRKLSKQQITDQRKVEEDSTAQLVDWMVNNRQFILKPRYIINQLNTKNNVNSQISFLAIDSNIITIELESEYGMTHITPTGEIGVYNSKVWNGGVLIGGTISKYELIPQEKPEKGYIIRMYIVSRRGSVFNVLFNVLPGGIANAVITGDSFKRLSYYGSLEPLEYSLISRQDSFF